MTKCTLNEFGPSPFWDIVFFLILISTCSCIPGAIGGFFYPNPNLNLNPKPFSGQSAPSPYVKETSEDIIRHIKHNPVIVMSICVSFNPVLAVNMFKDGPVALGWPTPSLKTVFSTAVTYHNKMQKGIISSWKNYADNHVSI